MDERKFKQSEPLSPHIHLIPLSPEHAEGQEPEPCEWDFRSSSCRYLLLSPVIDLLNWLRIYRVVTQVPVPLNCNRVASCTALVSLRGRVRNLYSPQHHQYCGEFKRSWSWSSSGRRSRAIPLMKSNLLLHFSFGPQFVIIPTRIFCTEFAQGHATTPWRKHKKWDHLSCITEENFGGQQMIYNN